MWAYGWDGENRLTSVAPVSPASGSKKVESAYDYMGRRVQKVVSTYSGGWSATETNWFVYDGWNLVSEIRSQGSGVSTNDYVWGLDLSGSIQGAGGIGGLLCAVRRATSTAYFYHFDGNGNVVQLVTAGGYYAQYRYDPYGNIIYRSGTEDPNNPFHFSTKYQDAETGLVMYQLRPYSPTLGRWLCRDPKDESGGLNLYLVVRGGGVSP